VKLVYCGTPIFAVAPLESLHRAGHQIALVVTQPDRPKGRGMELAFSPVKQKALELGLAIAQPEKIKSNEEFRSQLETIAPEAIAVVGYGRLIPRWMLDLPPLGNINLHASLLPKYRGAAPIQWAIARGERVTGNTTMRLDEGLDTGNILLSRELPIADDDTALTLAPRLAVMGAELLMETFAGMAAGVITPRQQDHHLATLAPILTREDGRIDFFLPAQSIVNRLRGFQPWPGAFTTFRGKQLTLHSLTSAAYSKLPPGELRIFGNELFVGCGSSEALLIREVQLEGKRRMSSREFLNGYQLRAGERLGERE
jgi:methionyl-tRNA formyltransferase